VLQKNQGKNVFGEDALYSQRRFRAPTVTSGVAARPTLFEGRSKRPRFYGPPSSMTPTLPMEWYPRE
jgi:hypothetical protein